MSKLSKREVKERLAADARRLAGAEFNALMREHESAERHIQQKADAHRKISSRGGKNEKKVQARTEAARALDQQLHGNSKIKHSLSSRAEAVIREIQKADCPPPWDRKDGRPPDVKTIRGYLK